MKKKLIKILFFSLIMLNMRICFADYNKLDNLKLLADAYISQNKFNDAALICKDILAIDPKNEIITTLARINSWVGDFDESIKNYDKAILLKPGDIDLHIEKVRVIGWSGKQKEATLQYELIYNKFKFEWIRYEMLGKKSLWDHKIKDAIGNLEMCIEQNPKNPEVLFDIAQLYSYLQMYTKADKYYQMLMEASPYNSAGKKSSEKNKWISSHPEITIGFSRWLANSKERLTDIDLISNSIMAKKRFNDNYAFSVKYIKSSYTASGIKSNENMSGVLFDYYRGLEMGAGAYFYLKDYEENEVKDGNNFTVFYWRKLLQNLDANISFRKENLLNNYNNIKNDLNSKYFDLKIDWDINKSVLLTSEMKKGNLSDDNDFFKVDLNTHFTLTQVPKNLYTELGLGKEMYGENTTNYFAPGNYMTYSGLIGFAHHFGREGLFYGAKDYYYNVFYKIARNSNNETSKQPGLILYMDLKKTLSIKLQYLETISYYYKDKSYSAMLTWYP